MGVGEPAATIHRGSEFGAIRDPAFDDGRRHLEELRQLVVAGAEFAVVARELAVFGAVAGGMADGVHGPTHITIVINGVNDKTTVTSRQRRVIVFRTASLRLAS